MVQLGAVLQRAKVVLQASGSQSPDLDVRLLAQNAFGISALDLVVRQDMEIDAISLERFNAMIARRENAEPVHRILGEREFYGLTFKLSAATLEPRPDTEALIELALPFLQEVSRIKNAPQILDMGTGTGAIVITLLHKIANAKAVAVDISEEALNTAMLNAQAAGVDKRLKILQSDWLSNVSGQFDMIVSNPPYIPHHEIAALACDVKNYDPVIALDGGKDGLDFYRALALNAANHLYKNGMVCVEIGAGQYQDVEAIFSNQDFELIQSAQDLGGHERAMLFKWRN